MHKSWKLIFLSRFHKKIDHQKFELSLVCNRDTITWKTSSSTIKLGWYFSKMIFVDIFYWFNWYAANDHHKRTNRTCHVYVTLMKTHNQPLTSHTDEQNIGEEVMFLCRAENRLDDWSSCSLRGHRNRSCSAVSTRCNACIGCSSLITLRGGIIMVVFSTTARRFHTGWCWSRTVEFGRTVEVIDQDLETSIVGGLRGYHLKHGLEVQKSGSKRGYGEFKHSMEIQ